MNRVFRKKHSRREDITKTYSLSLRETYSRAGAAVQIQASTKISKVRPLSPMHQLMLYTRCEIVLLCHTQKDRKSPHQSQAPRWLGIPFSYCWHKRRKSIFLSFSNRNFSILLKLHSIGSYVKSLFFIHNSHNKFNPPKCSQCNDYQLNETKRMQWTWGFFSSLLTLMN